MEATKNNRAKMKLSKEETERMCQRIRQLGDLPVKDIGRIINKEFKVSYDRSSIKYWYEKTFPELWQRKLQDQEEIMQKWKKETEIKKPKDFSETFAENLSALFNNEITKEEFKENLLNC